MNGCGGGGGALEQLPLLASGLVRKGAAPPAVFRKDTFRVEVCTFSFL